MLQKIEKAKQRKAANGKNDSKDDPDGESEGEEGDGGIDKGPSLCSVDQSAITGESLAVDKFIVSSLSIGGL